ncbi:uncharacterized protein SPSK_02864 [Sporothrix schenckii 1099-18]|uniref:Uncharacterized protein n=1 Tax=Sporothrix schenckii 1099-18 TaxID=1397361 RepID=A0A0F2MEB2_SPOSC|nr:uncharacterized protein SPSK_02864 [Sporothrix schenckii 1099-18]KJR86486.1 hypothetical protein SPSK_02864 [Sporothrix schenckii 1099-18]
MLLASSRSLLLYDELQEPVVQLSSLRTRLVHPCMTVLTQKQSSSQLFPDVATAHEPPTIESKCCQLTADARDGLAGIAVDSASRQAYTMEWLV